MAEFTFRQPHWGYYDPVKDVELQQASHGRPHLAGQVVGWMPAQGWQCPVCKNVWAPGMAGCATCAAANKKQDVTQQAERPGTDSAEG